MPRLEEPCGIPSAPALLQLSRFAARDVKVVLAGQGADEPHGGYGRHQAAALLGGAAPLPAGAGRPGGGAGHGRCRAPRAPGAWPTCSAAAATPSACCGWWRSATREVRAALAPAHAAARRRPSASRARRGRARPTCAGRGLLEQALYLDTRMFLPDGILICNDKMSMAASLELRVPFLDVELMRFVERIPAGRRVRPRAGQAPAPHGDGAAAAAADRGPAEARLLDPLRRLAAGLARARRCARRYAPGLRRWPSWSSPAAVARLVDEHRRGRADHKAILYCLLELSEWHRAFVEAREPVAA